MAELTDEQIAEEEKFLEGIPRLNIGALFAPPVWGPVHGLWVTIGFYPLWLLADNCFYLAWTMRTTTSIVMAGVVFICLTAITFLFARISQPFVAHRYIDVKGWTKERYIARQRAWAVAGVLIGCVALVAATYYNLVIRPMVG